MSAPDTRRWSLRCLALLTSLATPWMAQAESGALRFTSTSFLTRPASVVFGGSEAQFVVSGGDILNASDPVGTATQELASSGTNTYTANCAIVRGTAVVDTGLLTLQAANTDTNGNLLADHLEVERAASLSVTGTVTARIAGGTNYTVTGSFVRASGSPTGSYTLFFSPVSAAPLPNNPSPPLGPAFSATGTWAIFGFDPSLSRLVYERATVANTYRFDLRGLSDETSGVTVDAGEFTVDSDTQVTLRPTTLRTPRGTTTLGQASLRRTGTRYVATLGTANPFSGPAAWPGFRTWVVEFTDLNDSDANGVPEFSDPTRLAVGVTINTAGVPAGFNAGQKLTLTAITTGRRATVQWYRDDVALLGATSTTLTIDSVAPDEDFNSLTTFGIVATTDVGATASDYFRTSVGLPPTTLLPGTAQPGVLVPVPGAFPGSFNSKIVGPNALVFHNNLPDAVLMEWSVVPYSKVAGAEMTLVWRADFSSPAATAGVALRLVSLGDGTLDAQIIDPSRGIIARATGAAFSQIMVEDDGTTIRVGFDYRPFLSAKTTFRRGRQLGILGAPTATAPEFSAYQNTGVRFWPAPWLLPAATARAINLSTRGFVGDGDKALIAGVVVATNSPRNLLFRAVGPELGRFGVSDPSPDTRLGLYSGSSLLTENAGWSNSSDSARVAIAAEQVGAFGLTLGSRDSALLRALPTGVFTAMATGAGSGMVEIYDQQAADESSPFVNLSTRGYIPDADHPLIAGFVVTGAGSRLFLLRAIGPALRRFGITNPIANPKLALYDGAGHLMLAHDDWTTFRLLGDLDAVFKRVGAFSLMSDENREAVMLVRLPAGTYTAQVSSSDGSPGWCLVEIYDAHL